MNYIEKYKLNKNISEEKLSQNGFKNGTFKCFIYKELIQLVVHIDIESNYYEYQVVYAPLGSLYTHYYEREYGKSKVVKMLDGKINRIFREMCNQNILEKKGKMYGKKNSKIS